MRMRRISLTSLVVVTLAAAAAGVSRPAAQGGGPLRFAITVPAGAGAAPLDGRLLLMIAKDPAAGEPRFQISDGPAGQLVFGIDVDGWAPGTPAIVDASAIGFPLASLADVPAGTYSVQALLHVY